MSSAVAQPALSKSRVDRIGDALRNGELSEDVLYGLEAYRAEFTNAYRRVEHVLRDVLDHQVTGRPAKSTVSIIDKLRRQKTRLAQMQDIAGCRAIVANIHEQDRLVQAAEVMFSDVTVDDKRANPTHGYRAVHLIVKDYGRPVEVQVRTMFQHFWAELSEKVADTYGHEIKYGQGESWALPLLVEASDKVRRIEELLMQRVDLQRQARSSAEKNSLAALKRRIKAIDAQVRGQYYSLRELISELGA